MNIYDLMRTLQEKGARWESLSVGKVEPGMSDKHCIVQAGRGWEVYYLERDTKVELRLFDREAEACAYFLAWTSSMPELWAPPENAP